MISPNTTELHLTEAISDGSAEPRRLPFPPLTKQHILNCAYNAWWPKYRSFVPKSRIIPLTQPFIDYFQADGIFLPSDNTVREGYEESDEEQEDVAAEWRPLHEQIQTTIKELGGKVLPKLNWSAPKDATHMLANSMACSSADDIYLLLKSSDFISFDLNHAFDGTVDDGVGVEIPWHLILRKSFNMNPSLEFRCFVKGRRLIGVSQRDMNYYAFLHDDKQRFLGLIQDFFEEKLKASFAEENYVFDVYVPDPHTRVWLVDINPWAERTDPLLFSWLELLEMEVPPEVDTQLEKVVRLQISTGGQASPLSANPSGLEDGHEEESGGDTDEDDIADVFEPQLRLLHKDDPEAYSFASPQYSAHKMPKDVVDATAYGNDNALRELSMQWKEALSRAREEDASYESSDEEK